MPTTVAQYGLLAPLTPLSDIEDQMRAGHRYYNRLIEIERTRRTETRALLDAQVLSHVETVRGHRASRRPTARPVGTDSGRDDRPAPNARGNARPREEYDSLRGDHP